MKLLSTILLFVAMLVGHGDGTEKGFSQQTIPDAVFERMQGRSYPVGCEVNRNDLRYSFSNHVTMLRYRTINVIENICFVACFFFYL